VAEHRTQIRPVAIPDPLEDRNEQDATWYSNDKPDEEPDRRSGFLFGFTIFMSVVTGALVFLVAAAVLSKLSDLNELRAVNETLVQVKEDAESLPLEDEPVQAEEPGKVTDEGDFDNIMAVLNPDYVCWLKIDGTAVDYPVVRAGDNEKYLNLSFDNEENVYGSIFMDYRCGGADTPHIIIYGHNTKDGDMFGGLRSFLDKKYVEAHPVIKIIANDETYEYEIFSARMTDITDPAYNLRFEEPDSFERFLSDCGASKSARQVVTLSTCVSGSDKDERVVVQGMLR
jgi:SrtB family sortase